MTQLTWLSFQNNNLASVPEEMGQLTNLLTLNISENNLTSIPQEICDLETLHGANIIIEDTVTCD